MSHRRALLALALAVAACAGCSTTPEAARDHMRRGDAALAAGHYTDAYAAYAHARDLAPHDPAVQQGLMRARAYAIAEQPSRTSPDVLDDARYEAQVLCDTDKPHEAVYLTALGSVLARQGDMEGAKAKLQAAVASDPGSLVARTALGALFSARRETAAQAKVELTAALKIKPDHAPALVAMAQLEMAEGDVAGAAAHLEAALHAGDDVAARLMLGNARLQQQRAADAVEQFQRATQLDPRSAEAFAALGDALLAAGHPDAAERALRTATQLRPDPGTATALGFALARQKKSEQALGVFGQVLQQDASAAPALFGAAVASEDLGRAGQALDYYRRVLAIPVASQPAVAEMHKEAEARVAAINSAQAAAAAAAASASAAPLGRAPPAPPGKAPRAP